MRKMRIVLLIVLLFVMPFGAPVRGGTIQKTISDFEFGWGPPILNFVADSIWYNLYIVNEDTGDSLHIVVDLPDIGEPEYLFTSNLPDHSYYRGVAAKHVSFNTGVDTIVYWCITEELLHWIEGEPGGCWLR